MLLVLNPGNYSRINGILLRLQNNVLVPSQEGVHLSEPQHPFILVQSVKFSQSGMPNSIEGRVADQVIHCAVIVVQQVLKYLLRDRPRILAELYSQIDQ